jgi:hypothetical protein
LTLGGKGKCRGYLLGEENKGMRAMFLMMNEARLHTGLQGFGLRQRLLYQRGQLCPRAHSGTPLLNDDAKPTLRPCRSSSIRMCVAC